MLFSFTGTLSFEPTEGDRPAAVAVAATFQYSQKALLDLNLTTGVTNQALNSATVTAPRAVFIEVTEGSMSFSWDSAGAGAEVLSANSAPPPSTPAVKLLMNYDPATATLHVTTTAPAKGRVWFFA